MKKMNPFILILFPMVLATNSFGQDCTEFKKHLKSIDSTYFPGNIIDRMDTVFNANRAFVDYTIENLLDSPSDKCFISNRSILRKLKVTSCDSSKVEITDTLLNGESCVITLVTGNFKSSKHEIIANEDSSQINKIDGQYPYGGQYELPEIEIDQIQIVIEGLILNTPKEAYRNFYSPLMCDNYGLNRQIEAYESLNGKYIYIYLFGGKAAGMYFAKLIFDKTKYLTRIASDYFPLSIHSSFRDSFIGF